MPTILVIEDDSAIRRGVTDALRFSGYAVLEAAEGLSGMEQAQKATFDLMLLDLVLPNHNGFEILRALKEHRPGTPVIILSARGEEADRVKGLKLGADDYVVKPFSVRELLARVEAVLRRSPERPKQVQQIPFPGGIVDLERLELRFSDGGREELSDRECGLIEYLAAHRGRAISREELLRRVWRIEPKHTETRTIDMHIANLRAKLRDNGGEPQFLLTVRGKGYMLANEVIVPSA
ncbi:response regulator transcription factor [Prosthecobacter dejongeii]|uniref:DNA-binding response OmpR family regulator n=1 Tax=Prosthecobacter dejongeii TaxID=48465 RepID=A0A7W8DQN0_9BACT|nr:response regulator transcription factor [Prosthecobacter dejongeii]MBB5038974.1 DNA-binding response OmpR family regulator [Prosthecobacter dejongeii]